jgi:XTP/dITP diphosphohydrolase
MLIYAATTNEGKLHEFLNASSTGPVLGLRIEALPAIKELTPPDETGTIFEENAAIKAQYYSRFTNDLVFADDSGLEVDALQGAPGVYSARYAAVGAGDQANNYLLLKNMTDKTQRTGRFVCAIALAQSGVLLTTTRGAVEGEILTSPRGQGGFGYDPLFLYPPYGQTFAEIGHDLKFEASHRGKAFRALLEYLAGSEAVIAR